MKALKLMQTIGIKEFVSKGPSEKEAGQVIHDFR